MLALALGLATCVIAQPRPMELLLTDFDDGAQATLVGQQLPPNCSADMVAKPVHSGKRAAHLHYNYPKAQGIMFSGLGLSGAAPHILAGKPSRFNCWVYGNGSGLSFRLRLDDSSGQTFQYDLGKLDFHGWRQLSCDIAKNNGHWGGNGSGKMKLPLSFESLLVDSDVRPSVGDIYIDDLSYDTMAEPKDALQITAHSGWFGDVVFSDKPWDLKVLVRNMSTAHVRGDLVLSAADSRGNPVASATKAVSLEAGQAAAVELKPSKPAEGLIFVRAKIGATTAGPFRLAVLPHPSPMAAAKDGFFGACTHFGQGKHKVPQTVELMRQAGIEWLRDEIGWGTVERTKGVYSYDPYYEAYMGAAGKYGVRPYIIADYTNKFYDKGQAPHDPEGWNGLANYAAALAKHYHSVLHDIEVYNEPNIGFWSGRKPSYEEYFGLLKATYTAIKKAEPNDTVVGCCTAGTDFNYIEGVLKLGGAKYMDALSIHPYRYPGSPESTHFVQELNRCYELMCHYGMQDKKLWLTEIGWPTQTGPRGVSDQTSADYLVRMYTLAKSLPFVERVFWYDLQDDGRDPTYNEARFGLLTFDDSQAKAGFVGYYVMTRYLTGAKFVRKLLPSNGNDQRYAYLFRQGDRDVLVAWDNGREDSAAFSLGGKTAHLQWVDAHREDRATPGGVLSIKLTDMPVFIAGNFPDIQFAQSPVSLTVLPEKPVAGDEVTLTAKVSPELARGGRTLHLTPPEGWGEARDVKPAGRAHTVTARFRVPKDARDGPARFALTVRDPDKSIVAEAARSVVVSPFLQLASVPSGRVKNWTIPAHLVVDNPRDVAEKAVRIETNQAPAADLAGEQAVPAEGRLFPTFRLVLDGQARQASLPLTISASARGHTQRLDTTYSYQRIQRSEDLKIDGNLADWQGIAADFLNSLSSADWISLEKAGAPKPHLTARVRVAWSPKGLWLAVKVRDDKQYQTFDPPDMWQGDSLQIAADYRCSAWREKSFGRPGRWIEYGFALANSGKQMAHCFRPDPGMLSGVQYHISRSGDSTIYEVFIPAVRLAGGPLAPGDVIGFSLLINDNDGAGRRGWLHLYRGIGYAKDPRQFGLFLLDPLPR